jgi:hypothetical protein
MTNGILACGLSLLLVAGGAELSPAAKALIAPVHEAYLRVAQEQDAMAPASSDAERLIRLEAYDQRPRDAYMKIDLSPLPDAEQHAATDAMWDEMTAHDVADQTALKAMLPPEGWFIKSRYGAAAEEAAFLIVQHAVNDKALQHAVLEKMLPLVARGEVDGTQYALLYDRVALHDGRMQLYGTQMICSGHKWHVDRLADPDHADARRKALGFKTTVAENAARFDTMPCNN